MASRRTILSPAVWSSGSTDDVYSRASHNRKARWHSGRRTLRAQRFVRGSPDEYAVGPSASSVLQWRSLMDLPDDAVSPCHDGGANGGNGTLARRWRNVASFAS